MTYNGQPSRITNTILKVLVIATIAWVAYWASNGGLEQIAIPENTATTTTVPATTSTTVAG